MQRIVVVGTSGSGKTTFARRLALVLGVPHIELDALHWEANWQEAPVEVFRERTRAAVSANAWSADGNYSAVRDIVWGQADTLVWLDYALVVILWRLIGRTVRRVALRQQLWSGNRETLAAQLSRDSIILWALRTYQRRRHEMPLLLQQPAYRHLTVIHLHSPQEAQRWLATCQPLALAHGEA
jgi:adenylate kinase family enzyme